MIDIYNGYKNNISRVSIVYDELTGSIYKKVENILDYSQSVIEE